MRGPRLTFHVSYLTLKLRPYSMARKSLKREPTTVQVTSQDHPVSSGDTIVMDQDATMTNGPVDERHCMENKRSGEFSRFNKSKWYSSPTVT